MDTRTTGDIPLLSLVPSLPAQSFEDIQMLFETLKGVTHGVQVDIVDGVFAPHTSWPFTEVNVHTALTRLASYTDFDIEIDCMCMHPEDYLDQFSKVGVKRVVIHAGSTERYDECIRHARTHRYRIGFGMLNTTPTALQDMYIPQFDFVQVMGIEHVGVQGQPFDVRTLETIRTLRAHYPAREIAVDGSVNEATIMALLEAGATRFAPGSAITKSVNPVASYEQLARMVGL